MKPQDIVAIILASTLPIYIILRTILTYFYPETVSLNEHDSDALQIYLSTLIGALSAYIVLNQKNDEDE